MFRKIGSIMRGARHLDLSIPCKWMNTETGELAIDILDIIRICIMDLIYYRTISLKWKYNKNGY